MSVLLGLKPATEIARRNIEIERAKQAPRFNWRAISRPSQVAPAGDWTTWLFLGGRGAGKTRAGAEWVKECVINGATRIALVGATLDDVRKVMIEGESGLLSVYPEWDKPVFYSSKREVHFPNGAIATVYSAEEPETLRGPQHDLAWSDELLKWGKLKDRRRQEAADGINRMRLTWDNLQFGLRLGTRPRQIVTSTPRPVGLLKEIMGRTDTVMTTDTTYANRANLAPAFFAEVIRRYEGTRFGRQELNAEILDDVPNALWTRKMLDDCLLAVDGAPPPDLVRIVVAVDPSGTTGSDDRDAVGIIVAGRGVDGKAYVLADWTCALSPMGWAKRVVDAYETWHADRIVAEVNFGGAMVEAVIQAANASAPVKMVTASRGKIQRAEPISALYEQGQVKHCKPFEELDEELIQFTSDGYAGERSPNRGDALVWALTELMIETGGQAWVDHYAKLAAEAHGNAPVQKESPFPQRPKANEGNELTRLYNEIMRGQTTKTEICSKCKKPITNGARVTDGFDSWHPICP